VKTHVKRIFIKLSAKSRAQAVVRAQSLGLLHNAQALWPGCPSLRLSLSEGT
jgi:hypothetical protein